MAKSSRLVNLLVYLVPVLGWLVVLVALRRNLAALYHACQALALNLAVVVIPLGWVVVGWAVAWVPVVGPVTSIALFSLVMAAVPALVIAWLVGMVNALRDEVMPVPVFGGWGDKLFDRMSRTLRAQLQTP